MLFISPTDVQADGLINHLSSSSGKTLTTQTIPVDRSHIRRFGCIVYYHKPPNQIVKSEKLAPRAVHGYLLGMQGDSSTNYKIWIPDNNAILHTPHVTFDEARVYKDALDLKPNDQRFTHHTVH